MKALTLWQPWASLLACGAKQYETRSWETKYRGKIAIHAAKRRLDSVGVDLMFECLHNAMFPPDLPYGCVIATAELVNCWRMVYHPGTDIDIARHIPIGAELDVPRKHPDFQKYIVPTKQEMLFGDWQPGRYAWEFANMTMLPEPIPAKGGQRIWNWE